jgi:hypothetical protein
MEQDAKRGCRLKMSFLGRRYLYGLVLETKERNSRISE